MEGWGNFFVAEVGAAAALAGLVLLAVSINLNKIIAYPALPVRAFSPLVMLLNLLIVSSLMLVPQSLSATGICLLIVSIPAWILTTGLQVKRWQLVEAQYRWQVVWQSFVGQAAVLPFVVAGLVTLSGNAQGIYWIVPGMALSFVNVFLDAWVLLIEINR